jgi:filamentous hemagglutinin family protein
MKISYLCLGFICGIFTNGILLPAKAQVISDGTTNTTVNSIGKNFNILNGIEKGNNLFHSFSNFSVPTGGSGTFDLTNTPNITTIFSRVTGGNVSNIDGLIRTLNSSNPVSLFLMNPNGIIFGQNARLDIGGSFVGTTANSIKFADGTEFSATNSTPASLLTLSVPIGLQMGQNPGAIQVQGTGHKLSSPPRPGLAFPEYTRETNPSALALKPGKTLALVGGDVALEGGQLIAEQGRIELGSVGLGQVNLTSTASGFLLNYDEISKLQDIRLSKAALVDATGTGGTGIHFSGRKITLTDGSVALIQNSVAPGGNITVKASELLALTGTTSDGKVRSFLNTESTSTGASGRIQVSTSKLILKEGGQLSTRAFGSGVAGDIIVNAADSIDVLGSSPISPTFFSSIFTLNTRLGSGSAGAVDISTGRLTILDGGIVTSASFGIGPGGNLTLKADLVEVIGKDPVFASPSDLNVATSRTGNAGSMTINTQDIVIRDGGKVRASTIGSGNAGNITVNASKRVEVTNSGSLESAVNSTIPINEVLGIFGTPTGKAGGIKVNTDRLIVNNAGQVTVKNIGSANGGTLQINANSILLDRKGALTATTVQGEGGNISIQANDLVMRRASSITTTAGGNGSGGNININAPIILGWENSDIVANATGGRGGSIQLTTQGIFGLKYRDRITPENDITASSEFGVNGTVQINNIGIDPNSGLVELPENLTDPSQQIASGCSINQESKFVATGRGGIPQNPNQEVMSDRTWSDIRDISAYLSKQQVQAQVSQSPQTLVQATSWHRNAQGKVELIADKSSNQIQQKLTCAAVPKS